MLPRRGGLPGGRDAPHARIQAAARAAARVPPHAGLGALRRRPPPVACHGAASPAGRLAHPCHLAFGASRSAARARSRRPLPGAPPWRIHGRSPIRPPPGPPPVPCRTCDRAAASTIHSIRGHAAPVLHGRPLASGAVCHPHAPDAAARGRSGRLPDPSHRRSAASCQSGAGAAAVGRRLQKARDPARFGPSSPEPARRGAASAAAHRTTAQVTVLHKVHSDAYARLAVGVNSAAMQHGIC